MATEIDKELRLIVASKEEALVREILEASQKELDNLEDSYYKSSTFQKWIIEMCNAKLKEYDQPST